MLFFRFVLVLIGTAVGFFVGHTFTPDIIGASVFAVMALLLMISVTKPLRKKQIPVSVTQLQEAPPKKSGKKLRTVGRVVSITAVGVSGVIAILTYVEEQKDREQARHVQASDVYRQNQDRLRQELSSSITGRVFDVQTRLPLANAAIGYMSGQRFQPLGRTAPDGSFRIEIPYSSANNYPIRIVVVAPMSGGAVYQTDKYLQPRLKLQNENIYVWNQAYR